MNQNSAWRAGSSPIGPSVGASAVTDRRALSGLQKAVKSAELSARSAITCKASSLLGPKDLCKDALPGVPGASSAGSFDKKAASELLSGVGSVLAGSANADALLATVAAATAGALRVSCRSSGLVAKILQAINVGMVPSEALRLLQVAAALGDSATGAFTLAGDCVDLAIAGKMSGGALLADAISGDVGGLLAEVLDLGGVSPLSPGVSGAMLKKMLPLDVDVFVRSLGELPPTPTAASAKDLSAAMAALGALAPALPKGGADISTVLAAAIAAVGKEIDAQAAAIPSEAGPGQSGGERKATGEPSTLKRLEVTKLVNGAELAGGSSAASAGAGSLPTPPPQVTSAMKDVIASVIGNGGAGLGEILPSSGVPSPFALAQAALSKVTDLTSVIKLPSTGIPDVAGAAEAALRLLAAGCSMVSSIKCLISSLISAVMQLAANGLQLGADILAAVTMAVEAALCGSDLSCDVSSDLTRWAGWLEGRIGLGLNAALLALTPPGTLCPGAGLAPAPSTGGC